LEGRAGYDVQGSILHRKVLGATARAIAFSGPSSLTARPELVEGPDQTTGTRERRLATQVGWFDKRRPELDEGLTTSGM